MPIRAGVLCALLFCSRTALSQECPIPEGANAALAHVAPEGRLKTIQDALNHDAGRAVAWRWGWVAAYGTIAVAQLALIPVVAPPVERYVGAPQAALALLPPLVLPLHVGFDAPVFDAKVKAAAPADLCALVKEGEEILKEDAHNEAFSASWVFHIVNVVYNFIPFAILGFGFHDWKGAALAGGVGFVLGEVQILTQPNNLSGVWANYKAGNIGSPPPPKLSFSISPSGAGVAGTF
jgi:hypothetical protein